MTNPQSEIVFLKLGGSLITDKTRVEHARVRVIRRLAREIKGALQTRPDLRLVLGHGSGSFGHVAAKKYETRNGVKDAAGWIGFTKVAAAAARLNQIVTDIFMDEDVPVISLPPSASACVSVPAPSGAGARSGNRRLLLPSAAARSPR